MDMRLVNNIPKRRMNRSLLDKLKNIDQKAVIYVKHLTMKMEYGIWTINEL